MNRSPYKRHFKGCAVILGINSFKTFMAYKDVMMLTDEEVRGRNYFALNSKFYLVQLPFSVIETKYIHTQGIRLTFSRLSVFFWMQISRTLEIKN